MDLAALRDVREAAQEDDNSLAVSCPEPWDLHEYPKSCAHRSPIMAATRLSCRTGK